MNYHGSYALGAAHALLVEAYGASRIADELLREELAAERLPWGAPLVKGPAPGPSFGDPLASTTESSAREGHLFFILRRRRRSASNLRMLRSLGIACACARAAARRTERA